MRRDPHARRRSAALVVCDKAERRRDDLAVFQRLDSGIFHCPVEVHLGHTFGEIPGGGEGRVAKEARLAIGLIGLPGLPVFRFALDRDALQRFQRIGAALGGNSGLDEITRAFLGRREMDRRGAREQRSGNA